MSSYTKDPAAVLDYAVDWSAWLGDDTITASTWTAAAGITIDSDTHTATVATVWLSGGTAGEKYAVVNHVTTAQGRQDERTLTIVVVNK